MSILTMSSRPEVVFDPSNRLHRQWVTAFLKTGSWRGCPVRFALAEEQGYFMAQIQKSLLMWYAQQEDSGKLATRSVPGRRQPAGLTTGGFELTI